MRKARLSNTEYQGSMTNWWRTCLANLSRYFSSLRWRLFSCGGAASARGAAATGETNNSDTNRDLTCFFMRSEEHTSELQSRLHLVCRLLLEKKKKPKSPELNYAIS